MIIDTGAHFFSADCSFFSGSHMTLVMDLDDFFLLIISLGFSYLFDGSLSVVNSVGVSLEFFLNCFRCDGSNVFLFGEVEC